MFAKTDDIKADLNYLGLTCELLEPRTTNRHERHNDLEINFLPDCSLTYSINNKKYSIPKGSIFAFWALMPHNIVGHKGECPYYTITVPFSLLHEWRLSKSFLDAMFKGEVHTIEVPKDIKFERKRFKKWSEELRQEESELYSACSLEICAYIKRFSLQSLSGHLADTNQQANAIDLVGKMAVFITNNYTNPIKVSDVAKEVGLHPDYANAIFKRTFCKTISDYINCQRITYAERKLAISDESITSLAYESGFNSICRFNIAFKKKHQITPREYRKKLINRMRQAS